METITYEQFRAVLITLMDDQLIEPVSKDDISVLNYLNKINQFAKQMFRLYWLRFEKTDDGVEALRVNTTARSSVNQPLSYDVDYMIEKALQPHELVGSYEHYFLPRLKWNLMQQTLLAHFNIEYSDKWYAQHLIPLDTSGFGQAETNFIGHQQMQLELPALESIFSYAQLQRLNYTTVSDQLQDQLKAISNELKTRLLKQYG